MDDLISRSKLLENIEEWHDSLSGTMNPADWGIQNVLQSVMDEINEAPPVIDAVHVVRCKDCVLWRPVGGNTGKCPFLIGEHQYTGDDHFCSCGERKEDTHERDL